MNSAWEHLINRAEEVEKAQCAGFTSVERQQFDEIASTVWLLTTGIPDQNYSANGFKASTIMEAVCNGVILYSARQVVPAELLLNPPEPSWVLGLDARVNEVEVGGSKRRAECVWSLENIQEKTGFDRNRMRALGAHLVQQWAEEAREAGSESDWSLLEADSVFCEGETAAGSPSVEQRILLTFHRSKTA